MDVWETVHIRQANAPNHKTRKSLSLYEMTIYFAWWLSSRLVKLALSLNSSTPYVLSHSKLQKNQVSLVSWASLPHMNSQWHNNMIFSIKCFKYCCCYWYCILFLLSSLNIFLPYRSQCTWIQLVLFLCPMSDVKCFHQVGYKMSEFHCTCTLMQFILL